MHHKLQQEIQLCNTAKVDRILETLPQHKTSKQISPAMRNPRKQKQTSDFTL